MKTFRKAAIAFGALFAFLLLLLALLPYVYRDRIAERLRAEINDGVNAHVHWNRAGLSMVRSFPNAGLRLDDLSVVGVDRFEGDTLLAIQRFRLVLDLGSVIRHVRRGDPIVVRSMELQRPAVRLRVLEDGTANWDIAKADTDTAPPDERASVSLSLRRFEISDGTFTLDDRQGGVVASITGLSQSLQGDFSQERATLATRTSAEALSLRFAGVPYLSQTRLTVNASVDADMVNQRFTFTDNDLRLNDLLLKFSGSVATQGENLALDLNFSTPSTDFSEILSLVPAVYAKDFRTVQASGTMSVTGRVQGEYGPQSFPALAIAARVDNGTFRYPDLPLPAREIFVDLAIDNPGGHVDSTVVALRRFHVVIGSQPIDAAFVLRTPVTDPDIDARARGSLDLADLRRTIKLDDVDELSGTIAADAMMRTRMSWVDAGQYDRITATGNINVARFALRSTALPHPMQIDTAMLRLTPRHAELSVFTGRIGSSDVRASGSLDNVLGYALRDEVLRGQAVVASNHFDLNEWRSEDEATEIIPVPANIDFTIRANAARVSFADLAITNARGGMHVKDQRVTLSDFRMDMLGGAVTASGYYETTVASRPTFDLDLRVAEFDIPTAFASLTTVQMLAPVARYARGSFSSDLRLAGAIGPDMTPVFPSLTGQGTVETARMVLQDFPLMGRLADALRLEQLRNPTLEALRSSIEIRDGRVHVSPFDVNVGSMRMTVAGSNGFDQSLSYALGLAVPRAELGAEANRVVANLVSRAGRAGVDLAAAEVVALGVEVGGTVTSPTIQADFAGVTGSVREGAETAVRAAIDRRLDDASARVDSAALLARERAQAEANRLVADAEEQAAALRAEARTLAETVRREGNEQADALLERATNPVARTAAQAGADRLRRESNQRADRIETEADQRANALVAEARRQSDALLQPQP
jgi:uncharacterized protein involved in outer membrane biogenesis